MTILSYCQAKDIRFKSSNGYGMHLEETLVILRFNKVLERERSHHKTLYSVNSDGRERLPARQEQSCLENLEIAVLLDLPMIEFSIEPIVLAFELC